MSLSQELHQSYHINNNFSLSSFPDIKRTLTIIQSFLKVLVYANRQNDQQQQRQERENLILTINSFFDSLLKSLAAQNYKQSYVILATIIQDFLLTFKIERKFTDNIVLKAHLVELFKLYFQVIDLLLCLENQQSNNININNGGSNGYRSSSIEGANGNGHANNDNDNVNDEAARKDIKGIFQNGEILDKIGYFFSRLHQSQLNDVPGQIPPQDRESLSLSNIVESLYHSDPILIYLVCAIEFKHDLKSPVVIQSQISEYFKTLDFYEFNILQVELNSSSSSSTDVDNGSQASISDSAKIKENYTKNKVAGLQQLIEFYIADIRIDVNNNHDVSIPTTDNIQEFLELNPFVNKNKEHWQNLIVSVKKRYKEVAKSIQDKQKQQQAVRAAEIASRNASEENALTSGAASDAARVSGNGYVHANGSTTAALVRSSRSRNINNNKYKNKNKSKLADKITQPKNDIINDRKQQVYKKFSRKHPHINMNSKLSSFNIEEEDSENEANSDHDDESRKHLTISSENSLYGNLKVLIRYNLLNNSISNSSSKSKLKTLVMLMLATLANLTLLSLVVMIYKKKKSNVGIAKVIDSLKNKFWRK